MDQVVSCDKILTVYVFGIVQVEAEDTPSGQSEDEDIVCYGGGDKVGGNVEAQLYPLHIEYGK